MRNDYRPGYIPGKERVGVYLPEELVSIMRVVVARRRRQGESQSSLVERALWRELEHLPEAADLVAARGEA